MMKKCVVLDGKIINVGEWDYQKVIVEVSPAEFDEEGNIIKDVVYEEVAKNPLPDGAIIEERDFEYSGDFGWREVKSLNEQKEIKISELKQSCQNAIFKGFTADINGEFFSFGFNELDQMNFTQQMILLVSGDTSPINWKTDKGVKMFPVAEFQLVIEAGKNHKLAQQTKYWQLEQQVLNATTIEEVETVNW